MATTDVRWFTSEMLNAPALSYKNLGAVLKTTLIDGFNQHNISSVVVDGSGLATVTTATEHGFRKWSVVRIEGADQAVLNDDWQVIATDAFTFQFQTDEVSAFNGSGTMTAKFAPVPGWTVQAEEGDNLALKSTAVGASGKTLVIEDTGENFETSPHVNRNRYGGFFSIVEDFVDFATMTQVARNRYVIHGGATTGNIWWRIFADPRFVILQINPQSARYTYVDNDFIWNTYLFGDIKSVREADSDDVLLVAGGTQRLSGFSGNWSTSNHQGSSFGFLTWTLYSGWLVRNATGDAVEQQVTYSGRISNYLGRGGFTYPNPPSGEAVISDVAIIGGDSLRGTVPGVMQLCHTGLNSEGTIIEAPDGVVYYVAKATTGFNGAFVTSSNVNGAGEFWVPINVPWR